MKAVFNGKTIAESDNTVVVEENHYFPAESVHKQYLERSEETYDCPWKGEARYFNVIVDGEKVESGAWVYPEPKEEAAEIKNHFAFWKGVEIKK